ncbi:MAG: hypothetical protein M0D57_13340 [Sphingobacteriales bacterium JAD_PAG50586_3]|nr:MAG: hypothetical protein M0D57_13340 [Sphingobacteriales bacterium JAD_PAG50586_3]
MKTLLLFACLTVALTLQAQDTTIVKRRNETITIIRTKTPADTVNDKHRAFDIGVGCR